MNTNFVSVDDVSNGTPIMNSADWQSAIKDLLTFWVGQGRCFSSGEVTAVLRLHRPDLRFSARRVGETLRDMFWTNTFPQYTDDGTGFGPVSPLQASRFTVGKFPDRTPENTEVFVYGPNQNALDSHEFEIFVPKPPMDGKPGETMDDAPDPAVTTPASQTGPGSVPHNTGLTALRAKLGRDKVIASGLNDGRLYIPRAAFEALCHLSGTALRAGDPVFVLAEPTKVTITMFDTNNGGIPRQLFTGKGSLTIPGTLPPSSHYLCNVDAQKVEIDLTVTV